MAAAYKKIFDVSITAQNTSEQRLANRRIIEYIQGKNDPGKMRTFSAFAAQRITQCQEVDGQKRRTLTKKTLKGCLYATVIPLKGESQRRTRNQKT